MKHRLLFLLAAAPLVLAQLARGDEPGEARELAENGWVAAPLAGERIGKAGWPVTAGRGLLVRLGEDAGGMVFDTETLRMAAGWTGGWCRRKGAAAEELFAPPEGATPVFVIDPGPGWSSGESFADPRKKAKAQLPLPAALARYRGLFRSGKSVVFSYTVGTAAILEQPAVEKSGDFTLLTRTFAITSPGAAVSVRLADVPTGHELIVNGPRAIVATKEGAKPDGMTVISVSGAPEGAELRATGGFLSLALPALTAGTVFKISYARGPIGEGARLGDAVKNAAPPADPTSLTAGGPTQWPRRIHTRGEVGSGAVFAVDTVCAPVEKIGVPTGLAFLPDGRAAVSTAKGDVWLVSGLGDTLGAVTWQRFAAGLSRPVGLVVIDEQIVVLGRDQFTRLRDRNHDGEADFFENFSNDFPVATDGRDILGALTTDAAGSAWFYARPSGAKEGGIFKLAKDATKLEAFGRGWPTVSGLAFGAKGEVTAIAGAGGPGATNALYSVTRGAAPGSPLGWVPETHGVHLSATGKSWSAQSGRQLVFGAGQMFQVIAQPDPETPLVALMALPATLSASVIDAHFHAGDGHLYTVGSSEREAVLQRVRRVGPWSGEPMAFHVTERGLELTFREPLELASVTDVGSYQLEQWTYRAEGEAAPVELRVSAPGERGRDTVAVPSAEISDDYKRLTLALPSLQPGTQQRLRLKLRTEDGTPLATEIWYAIHAAPAPSVSGR